MRIQATCVAIGASGVLLRGAPGAGKSDLALRVIATPPAPGAPGAWLVADDLVEICRRGQQLLARALDTTAGMLEVRGVGIRKVPAVHEATLALIVDLVPPEAIARLPLEPPATHEILGIAIPVRQLAAFEASAPTKLRLLMGMWGPNVA